VGSNTRIVACILAPIQDGRCERILPRGLVLCPEGSQRRRWFPVRTRQVIWSPVKNARAAPLDSVRLRAQSAMNGERQRRRSRDLATLRRTVSIAASGPIPAVLETTTLDSGNGDGSSVVVCCRCVSPARFWVRFPVTRDLLGSGLTFEQAISKLSKSHSFRISGNFRRAKRSGSRHGPRHRSR